MTFIYVLILLFSILNFFVPYIGWYISIGWQFKDAEPSDLALSFQKFVSAIVAIVMIIMIMATIGNSLDARSWPDQFNEKLSLQNIERMQIDYEDLTEEEISYVISIIHDEDMIYEKREDGSYGYGSYAILTIYFTDGTMEEISYSSQRFMIRPQGVSANYYFDNNELGEWIRKKVEGK